MAIIEIVKMICTEIFINNVLNSTQLIASLSHSYLPGIYCLPWPCGFSLIIIIESLGFSGFLFCLWCLPQQKYYENKTCSFSINTPFTWANIRRLQNYSTEQWENVSKWGISTLEFQRQVNAYLSTSFLFSLSLHFFLYLSLSLFVFPFFPFSIFPICLSVSDFPATHVSSSRNIVYLCTS